MKTTKKKKVKGANESAEQQAPQPETADQARARAQQCYQEMDAVLRRHHCRLVPQLHPELEPVGRDGSSGIVRASFGVIPDPLPE